jgi:hypothetical protein
LTTFASSYTLFDENPVGYAGVTEAAVVDGEAIQLRSFFSSSRGDIQTTTDTLEELNEKGGDYVFMGNAGWLISEPPTSSPETRYAPLSLSYSDGREDAATGSMNFADFNAILNDEDAFRSKSRILGWAPQGSGSVALSETFPSSGGADCPVKCEEGESSFNAIYRVGQDDVMKSSPGGR